MATAIASSNRAVSDGAAEYGVSWPTAHRALIAAAARWLPAPTPTREMGIDETRFRTVRWILDGITRKRSDPWSTSFVDCSATVRDRARVGPWPHRRLRQGLAGRADPRVPGGDPDGGDRSVCTYAAGIRASLPDAVIAVAKWHLVALAHTMVTEVRQRVTREHWADAAPPLIRCG
ncbi:MAG TPA: transposase [Microlunatus sp.]